jgi:AcrR family transcriptional regulator
MSSLPNPGPADDARRRKLLEAALGVFLRYGFKKTSMDEVARAADLSRQGLYLHFASKEELFRATLAYTLETSLAAAVDELEGEGALSERLARAFDPWMGRYIGLITSGASDLAAASSDLAGNLAADFDNRFLEALTRAIRGSGLLAHYKHVGLTARQLAETLNATARGLKYSSASREAFAASISVATRALCAPMQE